VGRLRSGNRIWAQSINRRSFLDNGLKLTLWGFRSLACFRQALALNNLAPRHQLATLAHGSRRPRLLPADRRFWVAPPIRIELLASGGTYQALRAAANGECAVNLSGGYHHARRHLSHGFCLVNDVALGIARLRHEGIPRRVLIIDLDLHQGDGNATIFAEDRDTYTISVHEEDLFPIPKARSDLDIGLPSFTGDAGYLNAVEEALQYARRHFTPEMIVYVAGSDPYKGDPLGSLQLTKPGLLARDKRVAQFARELRCPLVVLPAGGYSSESPSITVATSHRGD
jgi:acetoin utilization deacetylase AcuC-like enzyme